MKNNLRQLIFDQQLTMREFSRMAGISEGTLWRIRKGKMVPSLKIALAIARALGKSVEDIWG